MYLPTIRSYGDYANEGYGAHCMKITVPVKKGVVNFWYSYETLIAFQVPGFSSVDLKNYWGPTTGKHMNWLSHKSGRVDQEEFDETLEKQLKEIQYDEPFFIEDN